MPWTDTAVILVKPAPPADAMNPSPAEIAASNFPTLDNMHRAFSEMVQKTTYVRRGSGTDEHLEVVEAA
jgi:hypothetical protein